MSGYTPLWVKSSFSFLEGASHPEELVETAAALGLPGLALTDRDGLYGLVRGYVKAHQLGLPLLTGAQLSIDDGSHIVLLAQDRQGYKHLCHLLSQGRLRSPKGSCQISWAEVCEAAPGLLALWGGAGSLLTAEPAPETVSALLRDAFADRLYALLTRHRRMDESTLEQRLKARAERYRLPLVAGVEVLYHERSRQPLQDCLNCIRHGCRLTEAGRRLQPNAEYVLHSPADFANLFADLPAAVARTAEIRERCSFSLSELRYRYPAGKLPDGSSARDALHRLTLEGARHRYGQQIPIEVQTQLQRELNLIDELDYGGYFLTMHNILEFCRRRHILCQGRGSAANSAVCYCLGITAVDPIRMGLLFERFISRERAEPPDIDLDIEHQRREEVIQYVYDHYGRDHAAMVAVVIRYRAKSAIRDLGKVLGIPAAATDRFARLSDLTDEVNESGMAQSGLSPKLPRHRHFLSLLRQLRGFPRHLSIHPGGFLLGHEPVSDLVPVENAAMPDRTVIQWDKDDLESLGLFKVDLLGLGALTHVHRCLDLLSRHYGRTLTMASIPAEDAKTYDMICRGDTVGVFQIESRAQMAMLRRMRPRHYYDLVIEISIVRPGPIIGGMVHPYLRRRHGEEPVSYPHPELEPVLRKTLGVPLFQEQVMRLAMTAAGYTPGEADQLRRDMAAWRRRGAIETHRQRLIQGMRRHGIAPAFAEQVFQQISGFGEYGFPESHAASFALIAYVTAWLKCHYPAAFTCALLNAQPMGFYSPATILEDAKRHGVELRAIDIRHSAWDCTLEPAKPAANDRCAVRVGLRYIKGLSPRHWDRIRQAREAAPFRSQQDVARRTQLGRPTLTALAEAGALAGFQHHRRQALWQAYAGTPAVAGLCLQEQDICPTLAALDDFEHIAWDYRISDHSTHGHPLEPLRPQLKACRLPTAADVSSLDHGARVRYAGVVICRQHPSTAVGVTFMTLEDETGFVNLIVWKKTFERYRVLVKTVALLGVTGEIQKEHGVIHILAKAFWRPELRRPVQTAKSRDFR